MIESWTDWSPRHFDYYREHNRGRIPRLRRTMRKRDTDWGDTVGVLRKVTPTSESTGMGYLRHFVGLHDGGAKTDN